MAKKGKKPTPKSQKDISKSLHSPYTNPDTGESKGNPNDIDSEINRGEQLSFKEDNTKPISLGFKEIDEAIFYYIENIIKPTVVQNGNVIKVPVLYGNSERWKQIQKDGYYRDKNGALMMPVIVFKRSNIEKIKNLTNKMDANSPINTQIFTKTYSPKNTYDNFSILNNRIPVKQHYAVVVPDYVTVTYDFSISTYYIEQLNKLVEAINYASDSYWGDPESFKFKATVDSFSTPVEVSSSGERSVKCNFTLKLYGYVIPDTTQKQLNSLKKFNSKAKTIFTLETVPNINNTSVPSRTEIAGPREFSTFTYPPFPSISGGGGGNTGVYMVTGSVTSSLSSSIFNFVKSNGDSFSLEISTSSQVSTSSLLTTASVNVNTITFTKGDGSTFPVTINTGSGGGGTTPTGSLLTTASVSANTITFTKGNGTTFPITISTGSFEDFNIGNSDLEVSSSNRQLLLNNSRFQIYSNNGGSYLREFYSETPSVIEYNEYVINSFTSDDVLSTVFNKYRGIQLPIADPDNEKRWNIDGDGVVGSPGEFHKYSPGYVMFESDGVKYFPDDGNYNRLKITDAYDIEGGLLWSYILTDRNTGSFVTTASVKANTITFTKGNGTTFPITINTGSGGGGTTPTGSLLTTASVNVNTITFTKGDGSTFPVTINTGSGDGKGVATRVFEFACSDFVSTLAPLATASYKRIPLAGTITGVGASLIQASTGAEVTVNIKKNGTTIFSTKPTIDINSRTTVGAAIPSVLSATSITADDEFQVDIDTVGTGDSGKGLIVYILMTPS